MKKIFKLLKLQFALSAIIILLSVKASRAQVVDHLYLDYNFGEWNEVFTLVNFNSLYTASDTGANYAAVAFNSCVGSEDLDGLFSLFLPMPVSFNIDSIFIPVFHENNSGLYNHFIVQIVSLIGDTQPDTNVLWQWEDSSNVTLSGSGNWQGVGAGSYLNVPVNLSMNQPFGVVFKYYDASFSDSFGIAAGYLEDGIGGPAFQSDFPNSWMSLPPTYNTIIQNSSLGYGFPIQNWWFIVKINSMVFPPCSAGFTMQPDTTSAHTWFALNTATGVAPIAYDWTWGDGGTATGATPSHTYATAGYYPICLTVTDVVGCTNTFCDSSTYLFKTEENMSMVTVNVVTELPNGISQINALTQNISIYPNPVNEQLTVTSEQLIIAIEISDVLGRVIYSAQTNSQLSIINCQLFPSGVYFIKAQLHDGSVVVKKFVKE